MGKKLNRTATKLKMTAQQEARRERLNRAGILLERWGQKSRQPIMPMLHEGESDPAFIEDQMTSEVVNALTRDARNIAELHWSSGFSAAEIAEQQALTRNAVRQQLGFVVEQVANKVLM
ncbi:hypothetical protein Q7C_2046 [Methylophaga frappieri]|uniref:Uncharacterized protein n=1 Tax=Methylophaga frappieri (strain ATCC BAA-2434 / DSM 25690 / JAM7) TaxID=754477 RepID=I1YJU2_METFJ|nr:hypothetical protein [Methylophaga frappieri]AFJ03185.1 hypothetical protein Q7C_2046 [Methylophaga frappieri]